MVRIESLPDTQSFSSSSMASMAAASPQKISKTLPEGVENASQFSVARFKLETGWNPDQPFTAEDKAFAKLTGIVYEKSSKSKVTSEDVAYQFLTEVHQGLKQSENFSSENLNRLIGELTDIEPSNLQPLLKEAKAMVDDRVNKKAEKYKNFEQVNEFLTSKIDPNTEFSVFVKTPKEFVEIVLEPVIDSKPAAPVSRAHNKLSFHFPTRSTILKVAGAVTLVGLGIGYYLYGIPATFSNLKNYLPSRFSGDNNPLVPPRTDADAKENLPPVQGSIPPGLAFEQTEEPLKPMNPNANQIGSTASQADAGSPTIVLLEPASTTSVPEISKAPASPGVSLATDRPAEQENPNLVNVLPKVNGKEPVMAAQPTIRPY